MGAIPFESDPNAQVSLGAFGVFGAGFSQLENITQDVVQEFYNGLAKGNETLKQMSDLVFAGLDATLGLPYAIIVGLLEKLFPWLDFPDKLSDVFDLIGEVPLLGDLIQALTGDPGGALADVTAWAQNLGQQILGPLVTVLVQVLDSIPIIGPPLGDALEDLAALFGIMKSNTGAAQVTADSALALSALNQAQLNSIGGKITDTFDRSAASNLGPDWDQSYMPGGLGYLHVNGMNDASWVNSGGGFSWGIARHVTALTSDIMSASIVVASEVPWYSTGDTPEEWVMVRENASRTDYVVGKIGNGWAEIGYQLGGVYTRLGARRTDLPTSTAGLWELQAGVTGDDYTFVLVQGGNEIMRRTDASHASQKDASHRFTGFGQYTGAYVSFFLYNQGVPPNIQAFTAIDRAATD